MTTNTLLEHLQPMFPAQHGFAQTNIQLFNQLAETCSPADLELVAAAYQLACELFGNHFRGSGKAFVAHLIGTASIIAAQGDRAELIAAALLHAAYANGEFDPTISGSEEEKRALLKKRVGPKVEALVFGYTHFAWRRTNTIPMLLKDVESLSDNDRSLVRMRLANELEEYLDLGIMHYDNFDELASFGEIYGDTVIDLARKINCDELAELLTQAFASVRLEPLELQCSPVQTATPITLEQPLGWNFCQQVQREPDKVAIKDDKNSLSYAELDAQSDRVAQALVEQLGTNNIPIVSLFGHDPGQAVAALGAWKANKIWVPIDAMHPVSRLQQIVKDTGNALLLYEDSLADLATTILPDARQRLPISSVPAGAGQTRTLDVDINVDDPACIIYTSGSTGRPKGVVHSHRSLLHLAQRSSNALKISPRDRLTLLPSCTQIAGLTDLLRALMNGATLLPFDVRGKSMQELCFWLQREQPSLYHSSPTLLHLLTENLSSEDCFDSVRMAHLGGEAVTRTDVALFRKHFSSSATLINNLGCSELSGYRQFFVDADFQANSDVVPAGYPVDGIDITVCDSSGNPLPTGDIGEIVVHSAYLSLGYWQQPEATAAVFDSSKEKPGVRRYKTGDQGYLQADGCLIFCGRQDNQIQIRGHRVDLTEIEAVLGDHPEVARVAVTPGSSAEKAVIAYVQPVDDYTLEARDLRSYVRRQLPAHMIPDIQLINELPATVNGKINYAQLKSLTASEGSTPIVQIEDAQRTGSKEQFLTDTERDLAQLWKACLEIDEVNPLDNFFEIGGDSLLVIRLVGEIESELNVTITLREVFGCDTLSELATLVVAKRMQHRVDTLGDDECRKLATLLDQIESLSEVDALDRLSNQHSFT